MPSVKEFHEALEEWQTLDPRPSLKTFLKKRFPDLTKEELQELFSKS